VNPGDPGSTLVVALFLATVANRLVEALVVPLYERFKWDRFSILYISWVVAGLLVWISGVNLFATYLPNNLLAGQILTAIVAGGGANFIADLFDRPSA
jgi:hypothetical protein